MVRFAELVRHVAAGFAFLLYPTVVFCPLQAFAEEEETAVLLQEIAEQLTFGNGTTTVVLDGCTLEIQTRLRTTCSYPTQPNWSKLTLGLNEIQKFETRPFREGFIATFELDVPSPPILQTQINRLQMDRDAAFEAYVAESDRLLQESNIVSNDTIISCTGSETVLKQRSLTLFLDQELDSIGQLETLIAQCRR